MLEDYSAPNNEQTETVVLDAYYTFDDYLMDNGVIVTAPDREGRYYVVDEYFNKTGEVYKVLEQKIIYEVQIIKNGCYNGTIDIMYEPCNVYEYCFDPMVAGYQISDDSYLEMRIVNSETGDIYSYDYVEPYNPEV